MASSIKNKISSLESSANDKKSFPFKLISYLFFINDSVTFTPPFKFEYNPANNDLSVLHENQPYLLDKDKLQKFPMQ